MTSVKQLRESAMDTQRKNRISNTDEKSYIDVVQDKIEAPIIAVTDFMKAVPDLLTPFIRLPFATLGTEGFGLSDSRQALRSYFETDSRYIAATAIKLLNKTELLKNTIFSNLYEIEDSPSQRHA